LSLMNNIQTSTYSVAILAGGQSRRMGQNKALMQLQGETILQRVINVAAPLTDDLFLVTNTPHVYRTFNLPMVADILPGNAALGGIYTAITKATYDWVLVLACDMPLLDPNVITFLAAQRRQADVVVPQVGARPETLHAFYKKSCLPVIEAQITAHRLKIVEFFDQVVVQTVSKTTLQTVTSDFNFLINLNTPEDLQRVKSILRVP